MSQTLQPSRVQSIEPHGGELINLVVEADEAAEFQVRAGEMPRHTLSQRELCDLEMLAIGAFSPLDGFMTRDDYRGAVEDMRLTDGALWPFPVTLGANTLKCDEGDDVALYSEVGKLMGILHVEDVYSRDTKHEARETYGTDDEAHPGVIQAGAESSPSRPATPSIGPTST